ncbi:hypothetical protein J8273_5324 [Carpediemonas membranifera]|uniref:Tctex-1 family protein n=1 Tax=Carpediemonas membranifera TaxID=201153 RepID=A0A8J6DYJ1_9EUKA|nr:hypothetical protein J8273_5324 [Carpediemonas membranifera]|eukprot:KAG9392334.1 hypothetical protein J8273_5324 [Carpediemonas membranifera]
MESEIEEQQSHIADQIVEEDGTVRPGWSGRFRADVGRAIMKKIVDEKIGTATYDSDNATSLVKVISDEVRAQMVALNLDRYKYGVNTVISERRSQGMHVSMRNFWDTKSDNAVTYHFSNESIMCLCTAFAAYIY